MFKRVLIAEDHELANFSVQKTLEELGIPHDNKNYVFYCDHALARIQKALGEGKPYELLITDLSFEDDSPGQKICSGIELIKAAKEIQADLKVLVFSIENRAFVAESLMADLDIDAYVPKARGDARDLKDAIEVIYKDKKYLSRNLKQVKREKSIYEFTALEKTIVSLISQGKSQKQISIYLEQNQIKPSSLSSIEKCLNNIKTVLNISNTAQLVAYCKDEGII